MRGVCAVQWFVLVGKVGVECDGWCIQYHSIKVPRSTHAPLFDRSFEGLKVSWDGREWCAPVVLAYTNILTVPSTLCKDTCVIQSMHRI